MIAPSHLDSNYCKHKNSVQRPSGLFERLQMVFTSSLSVQQKALLIRIALYAGDDGECFASAKTLQRDLSISRSHLYSLLRSIEHLLKTDIRAGKAYRSILWDVEFTPVLPATPCPADKTSGPQDCPRPVGKTGESSPLDSRPYIEHSINTQRTHISEELVFLNRFEQRIDHEIDWVVSEHEFMTRWNSTIGVSRRNRPAVPGDLKLRWMRLWSDEAWRQRAIEALDRFPLQNGSVISLKRFLEESAVDDILGGVYDFQKGKTHDSTRFPSGGDGWAEIKSETNRARRVSTG